MEEIYLFECPFKWNISDNLIVKFNEHELFHDEEIPFLNLMNSLMLTYIYAVKNDYNEAQKYIKKLDDTWNDFDKETIKKEGISVNVVDSIIRATKYYVLKRIKNLIDDTEMDAPIDFNNVFNKEDRGTLNGCKSVAFSVFFEDTSKEAISFAKIAIADSPDCSMWHFILGKNLRRIRRLECVTSKPTSEEMNAFLRSYKISNNPLYGIYLVQAYSENKDFSSADILCAKIYEMNLTNPKVQLRLGRFYLKSGRLDKAKMCFDYVETVHPESNMLSHHLGIYYIKKQELEIAAVYLKKASQDNNFGASLQYGEIMECLDENFSFLFHLFLMLKNFRLDVYQQQLRISIGLEYFKRKNYEKSLKNLIIGIKINPISSILTNLDYFTHKKITNIFLFIEDCLIPNYKSECMDTVETDILSEYYNIIQEFNINNQYN